MLRERGNTSSTRKLVLDPRISYEIGKVKQLIPRITYGTSFPQNPKVGDFHYYQGDTEGDHVKDNWYAAKPSNTGWQSVNATSITGANISGEIPSGVTIADYISKFGGVLEGVLTFFKDQILPAEMIKGKIPAGVTIEDYLSIYGGTMLGSIILSGFNLTRTGLITGRDTDIKITMNEDGKLTLQADQELILSAIALTLIGALALTGSLTISGDLQVNGGEIGISTDTDLITLAADLLTLRGSLTLTVGNLTLALGSAVNEFSIDGTLAGNADNAVPTEKAVKTYADTKTTLTAVKADSDIADALTKRHTGTTQLSQNGISGSFTTVDLKTVTVVDGQITNIAP
jgi:hypothetical protein